MGHRVTRENIGVIDALERHGGNRLGQEKTDNFGGEPFLAVRHGHGFKKNLFCFNRAFVLSNESLYERIAALASKRMHETVLLDEDFRRERERIQRSSNTLFEEKA